MIFAPRAVLLQPFLPVGWGFCFLKKFPGGRPGGGMLIAGID